MNTQLELIRGKAPIVGRDEIKALIGTLEGMGWLTAKHLSCLWSDRDLRAIANASKGAIISGQKGYCLNSEATEHERKHAANWLRHQARQMLARATEIETWKQDQ